VVFVGVAHSYVAQRRFVDAVAAVSSCPPGVSLAPTTEKSSMSFDLTSEQRAFRDVMHNFVDERIAPNAARYDRDQVYPRTVSTRRRDGVALIGRARGLRRGRRGHGHQAIMAEELARGCASTSVTLLISKLGMLPIMNFASEEIKHQYLPRIANGEIQASYCFRGRRRIGRGGDALSGGA